MAMVRIGNGWREKRKIIQKTHRRKRMITNQDEAESIGTVGNISVGVASRNLEWHKQIEKIQNIPGKFQTNKKVPQESAYASGVGPSRVPEDACDEEDGQQAHEWSFEALPQSACSTSSRRRRGQSLCLFECFEWPYHDQAQTNKQQNKQAKKAKQTRNNNQTWKARDYKRRYACKTAPQKRWNRSWLQLISSHHRQSYRILNHFPLTSTTCSHPSQPCQLVGKHTSKAETKQSKTKQSTQRNRNMWTQDTPVRYVRLKGTRKQQRFDYWLPLMSEPDTLSPV